jgi:hypothetical protein
MISCKSTKIVDENFFTWLQLIILKINKYQTTTVSDSKVWHAGDKKIG